MPHYIQQLWWGDHCSHHCSHSTKHNSQLQPPFGPSVDSLCHPWFTTTNLSYRFTVFETSATALCGTTGNHFNATRDIQQLNSRFVHPGWHPQPEKSNRFRVIPWHLHWDPSVPASAARPPSRFRPSAAAAARRARRAQSAPGPRAGRPPYLAKGYPRVNWP